jgi:hypothetical protein
MTDTPTTAAAADLGMTPTTQSTAPTTPAAPLTPTTAAEARVQLNALVANKAWGQKYLNGDVEARRQFDELTTKIAADDPLESVMAGVQPNTIDVDETGGARARFVDQIAAVADLRERGIPDQAIRDLLSDLRPTREQHEMAKRFNARNFNNPEWVQRLLDGDPRANQDFISNSWAIGCYEESP